MHINLGNNSIDQVLPPLIVSCDNIYMKKISNSKLFQERGVSALSFSQKGDYCALATKQDHTVRIFRVGNLSNVDSWQELQELRQHSQTISEISWAPDNRLLTASHDRSVVVWQQTGDKWEKMLVNIDIKLSILAAKWAPNGRKFALGSACSTLALGFFNLGEQCWTISTRNNFTKAPITTLSFHPSCNLLALGSADFALKIVSCSFRKSKDEFVISSRVEDFNYSGPFAAVDSLYEILFSIDNLGGWINHVSFQNNGSTLLVIPHTNHVKLYELGEGKVVVGEEDVRWNGLPFLSGYINKNKELVLGGFDRKVARFAKKGNYSFENYYETNEKTNTQRAKRGLVAGFAKGIEKKENIFGEGPNQSEHVNAIKVLEVNSQPASYDVSGSIHFWS